MKAGLIFLQLFVSINCFTQTVRHLDDLSMTAIDNAVNDVMSQNWLPSVSVAVIYNGRVAYTNAYGHSAPNVTATTATKYPIASVSKTITGILAMRMVQNGDIALSDLVSNYVSGYNNTGIRIRHLLCHQSGIGHYDNCPNGYSGAFNSSASLVVVNGCSRCMTPVGSGTLYTTFGTTLLGVIIDKVGVLNYGKTYIQLYNEWIRDAAGLTDLTAEYNNLVNNIAVGYSKFGIAQPGYWDDIGWKLPAGGFVSTAHDLGGFGVGVMNNTFINSVSSSQMWQTQSTSGTPTNTCVDSLTSAFGLAFRVSNSANVTRIFHNGLNDHGFSSFLYLYPYEKSGIALLTNRYEQTDALDDIRQLLESIMLCPANRNFTSQVNTDEDWIYEATTIQASNTFATGPGSIVFDGGTEVILKPGFQAKAGMNFRAINDGCSGSVNPNKTEQK